MTKRRVPLDVKAADLSESPAIIDGDVSLTYLDYHQLIATMVDRLRGDGIETNQRVAIIADNSIEYIITLMALLHLGAVACPISTRLPSVTVENMLRSIDCQNVIASAEYVFDSRFIRWLSMFDTDGFKGMDSPLDELSLEQDATILFTSGTAAIPKAVLHTFGNHYYSALGSNLNIALKPADRWLLSLPLYHVGGLGIVFRCLLAGATVVIPPAKQNLADTIDEFSITHLSLVPTQLQALLDQAPPEASLNAIKGVLVGGGHVPTRLVEKAVAAGLPIHTTYGSTEMTSQVTTTGPDESPEKLSTCGKVLKYRQLKISDEGEILVKGETLFKGYVTSSVVQSPCDSDGWYATGDLGEIDSDGYLTVTGRKDNMFISGGENIYPEEIESAMRLLDGVEDAIVVPIDDARFGQRPVAFVRMSKTATFYPEKLTEELRARLPKFKIPVDILPWPDDTPRTGIKPDRTYFKKLANQSRG